MTTPLILTLAACSGGGSGESGGGDIAAPDSYCEGYVYVTPEGTVEQAEECGWEDPILSVKVDGVGTIFKPAVVSVNATQWGDSADWTYETDGRVERDGDKLYVYNTQDAEGLTTIEVLGEEIDVTLAKLPRCLLNGSLDCEGYEQYAYTGPLTYYGPDDTQVVEVELAFLRPRTETPERLVKEDTAAEEKWVASLNDLMVESGAYIRYKLVGVYWYNYVNIEGVAQAALNVKADLVHMWGFTELGICGLAYAGTRFRPGIPQASMSTCGIDTIAHELGHSMGLAHGPENIGYPREGYIFPQFGHGWMDICGDHDGVMSYGSMKRYYTNSKIECAYAGMRGHRQYTDSTYALNRVRYDVALIHNEYSLDASPAPVALSLETPDEIVVD